MEQRLRGIDILALFFGTVCLVEAVVCLVLQPGYRQLFAEFAASLPAFTRIMLQPATLIFLGAVPLAVTAEGVWRRRSERVLIALTVLAIACGISIVAAFAAGMYLPLMQLSDGVG